jgi:hypothetical protein
MTITPESIQDILAGVKEILDGSIPLIVVLFGVSLSFYIASRIVEMFPRR